MPELTIVHLGLLVLALVLGAGLGWILRSGRAAKEKSAVSTGWREQLESQQIETGRLVDQNKSLMEQISQYQGSSKESADRVNELTASLKEAFAVRDNLQQELRDSRNAMQVASLERDKLNASVSKQKAQLENAGNALADKDDRIFRLKKELGGWSSRLPALVERYKSRDREAVQLEAKLAETREQLEKLEEQTDFSETRVEPVNVQTLPGGLDASNDPLDPAMRFTASLDADDPVTEGEELVDEPETVAEYTEDDIDLIAAETYVEIGDRVWEVMPPPASYGNDAGEKETAQGDDEADLNGRNGPAAGANEPTLNEDRESTLNCDAESLPAIEDPTLNLDPDQAPDVEEPARTFDTDDDMPEDDVPAAADDSQASPYGIGDDATDGEPDDLQRIKGIGPAIEKTLNELGIFRYLQIAEISEYDIDRVAQQLKGFRSRIYREDWLGQARDLHQQKNENRH